MTYIVGDKHFSKTEWEYLLDLIFRGEGFDLPEPELDQDWIGVQPMTATDRMAEWDTMSTEDKYKKGWPVIVRKEGAKTWVEILEEITKPKPPSYSPPIAKTPSDKYFESSEGKQTLSKIIAICRKGEFSIYKSE